jgi:hypothetical protein
MRHRGKFIDVKETSWVVWIRHIFGIATKCSVIIDTTCPYLTVVRNFPNSSKTRDTYRSLFVDENGMHPACSNSFKSSKIFAEYVRLYLLVDPRVLLGFRQLTQDVGTHPKLTKIACAPHKKLEAWPGLARRGRDGIKLCFLREG